MKTDAGDRRRGVVFDLDGVLVESEHLWEENWTLHAAANAYAWQPADTATTVRVEHGETLLTDGPFLDAKEHVGGFMILEADDLDVALDVAARIPAARMGGAVEVRPLVER